MATVCEPLGTIKWKLRLAFTLRLQKMSVLHTTLVLVPRPESDWGTDTMMLQNFASFFQIYHKASIFPDFSPWHSSAKSQWDWGSTGLCFILVRAWKFKKHFHIIDKNVPRFKWLCLKVSFYWVHVFFGRENTFTEQFSLKTGEIHLSNIDIVSFLFVFLLDLVI